MHRQFKRVEAARRKGKSVKKALVHFCWYWRGERYRSNPRIKVQFSVQRLRTLFYQWRNNGRTPQALALHYRPARRVVKRTEIARFVRHAAAPGIFTFAAAFAAMQRTNSVSYSMNHLWRSLPAQLSKELRQLFHARRQQRGLEAGFSRFVVKGGWR